MRVDSRSNENREMLIKMNWFESFWDDARELSCSKEYTVYVCTFFFILYMYIEVRAFAFIDWSKGSEKWQKNKGAEESKWGRRAMDERYKCRWCPEIKIWHYITSNQWIYRFSDVCIHVQPNQKCLDEAQN